MLNSGSFRPAAILILLSGKIQPSLVQNPHLVKCLLILQEYFLHSSFFVRKWKIIGANSYLICSMIIKYDKSHRPQQVTKCFMLNSSWVSPSTTICYLRDKRQPFYISTLTTLSCPLPWFETLSLILWVGPFPSSGLNAVGATGSMLLEPA